MKGWEPESERWEWLVVVVVSIVSLYLMTR